ncbi:MAG: T9SS type A sorting domain-containing protein [Williamsia sp.]|nr:T9SS type A sorting domain-containing protein [Williamsia sp.]
MRNTRPNPVYPTFVRGCFFLLLLFCATAIFAQNEGVSGGADAGNMQYNFAPSNLNGASLNNPTSIQFGPDGRLYVGQLNGGIRALTIKRNASNNYSVSASEDIFLINNIPNHDDDGTVNPYVPTRQITGIVVKGTAAQPMIYVTSSDSRMGGPAGDLNLDTNSGILSLITKSGSTWQKIDLVRGLPRSEENHSPNGMQINDVNNMLYLAVGGFTNAGAPSTNFAYSTERALSAAILSIDLNAIMAMPTKGTGNNAYKYDIPTLDDPTRPNTSDSTDVNDPFGGNNGLNQAKLVKGGPVQIFSGGYRNSYDILITKTPGKAGRIYTIDNGANEGWGGYPENEGTTGTVTNNYPDGEPGSTGPSANHPIVNNLDNLHYIGNIATYVPGSFYGGHPNPVRANPAAAGLYTYNNGTTGVWRNSKTGSNPLPADWPPVPLDMADPREGQFLMPGVQDSALLTFATSTNGLAEYTASNFNNTLKGNILAAGYNNGEIFRIIPTADGKSVLNSRAAADRQNQDLPFASGFGSQPLDIIAQGDSDVFAGTVWVATYGTEGITIFEPQDFVTCTGKYDTLDDDHDGYTNADEVDNGTQPCSASSTPPDFDKDKISDLNDPDDDNDGIPDQLDVFPIDPNNGTKTTIPVNYNFYNNNPQRGFFGLGFTGLMSNKKPDNNYLKLFSEDSLIAGGAVGAFTLTAVSKGDALGTLNNQENAFQFGVKLDAKTGPFTMHSRMLGPFFNGKTPVNYQSQGMYIGTGDQSNYLKIVMNANGGAGGIEVVYENADVPVSYQFPLPGGMSRSTLDLYLGVDPIAGTVQPRYSSNGGTQFSLGSPIAVSGVLLDAIQAKNPLATGIISTSRGATPFIASWDFIEISYDSVTANGTWQIIMPSSGGFTQREENAFVDAGEKFYLMGGRGISNTQAYDPATNSWTNKAPTPVELNHFQALTIGGLVYAPGAFTGAFPHETPVPQIYMYNPLRDKWMTGTTIPVDRRRGSAGAVAYKNKIYLVSGIKDGHYAGWVKWFDEYDPATNTWKVLPDAPRARDHFHAVVINDKLYVAGGRRSSDSTGEVWNLTIPEVDVYDFTIGQWSTLPVGSNIPTPRGGAAAQVLGNELIVIGGESAQPSAHVETEALNVQTNTWRRVANMQQGRHGTQAIKSNNGLYIAAGAGLKGGDNLLTSMEAFYLFNPTIPNNAPITQSQLTATLDSTFKTTPLGTESNRTITLTNRGGTQDILVSSINLSGSADFTDSIPYALPFVIPAGRTAVISMKLKPLTAGVKTASIVVNHSGLGDSVSTTVSADVTIPYYRINAGGGQVTNSIGTFAADAYFAPAPGVTFSSTSPIAGTGDSAIYQTERTSASDTFNYAIPVNNGDYTIVMHFAELKYKAAGSRVFDVSIEGAKVLNDYDIFKKAGYLTATTEIFPVTVTDGTLNINFSSAMIDGGVDHPKVSAIELYGSPNNNQTPIADAGMDTVLRLPASSLTLNGSGIDFGGAVTAYNWTQLSGPATAVFSNKTIPAPVVSGLVSGTYVFGLTVTDNAAATSPADKVVVTVANALPATGLNYRYYEGNWSVLPNFNSLIPVKMGLSANVDPGIRNRTDSFGVVWEGNIFLPAAGTYQFETFSDEGSKLYFNQLYSPTAEALVNNDSVHAAKSVSKSVAVAAAGFYPIAITYFDKAGTDTMKIYWTGPGISRQVIPNAYFGTRLQVDTTAPTMPSNLRVLYTGRTFAHLDWNNSTDSAGVTGYDVFVNGAKKYSTAESAITADSLLPETTYIFTVKAKDSTGNLSAASSPASGTTAAVTSGLNYRYYEGAWTQLPNFNALTPVKTGVSTNINLGVRNKADSFGIVWEGYVNIPAPGTYQFETVSDEGSQLYFNSFYVPGKSALVNNDSVHLAKSVTGSVNVATAGLYPIAITYFDKSGADSMKVYWSGPGFARQPVPDAAFSNLIPADTAAPTVPANLKLVAAGTTTATLHWDASTDNKGVTAYDVYRNGVKKYTATTNDFVADSLLPGTAYAFSVRARDSSGNVSGAGNTLNLTTLLNGLTYKYYEGSWSNLPNFSTLTPVKTGSTNNVDIGVRPAGRNDNFAFVWEGNITIPAAGTYTFESQSDDGSRIYFNSLYSSTATPLVNHDGLHWAYGVSATVNVPAAGVYPIAITYFEKDGGESMQVYWSGPGISRQLIPDAAFSGAAPPTDTTAPSVPANLKVVSAGRNTITLHWDASTDNVAVTAYDIYRNGVKKYTTTTNDLVADSLTPSTAYVFSIRARDPSGNTSAASANLSASTTNSGLTYKYYEGNWNLLPNFGALTPVKTGSSTNIDLNIKNRADSFGVVWEGNITIPTAGTYTFEVVSDDGSKLYFNSLYSNTAMPLVSHDGLHWAYGVSATVNVPAAGVYPFALAYFEKDGGESVQVYWSGPGISRQLIPDAAFSGSLSALQYRSGGLAGAAAREQVEGQTQITRVYPNPFAETFLVDVYSPAAGNKVEVELYDFAGKLLFKQNGGLLPAGKTTLKADPGKRNLAPGVYIARILINGIPAKRIKLVKEK